MAAGDALVQPYVASVAGRGETSLVFAGDSFSHAVRKVPRTGDFRVQAEHGGSVVVHRPTADELRVARAALRTAPGTRTYARVDLVATDDGPAVMELELVEPELFLGTDPGAPARFAAAFLAEAGRGSRGGAGPPAAPRRAR